MDSIVKIKSTLCQFHIDKWNLVLPHAVFDLPSIRRVMSDCENVMLIHHISDIEIEDTLRSMAFDRALGPGVFLLCSSSLFGLVKDNLRL